MFCNSCALIIFPQNNFPRLLQAATSLLVRAGQPVTHMISIANHNHPTIQLIAMDKIKSFFLVFFLFEKLFHFNISHNREEKTITISVSS